MRNLLVIGGISVIAIVLGCLLFFFGPPGLQSEVGTALQSSGSSQAIAVASVPFTVLDQGVEAVSVVDRTNYRITSAGDFTSLWSLVYGGQNAPKIPDIDFSQNEVLAVFDGTHSTTGYSIVVKRIMDQNSTRMVTIDHISPDPSCQTTNSVTSPFEIIEVPRTGFALTHQDVITTGTCSTQ